ncbi:MAG: hypothetical protein II921_00425, partial [Treponema sp.]|nr:hypothetical protein [Treponema sp.]
MFGTNGACMRMVLKKEVLDRHFKILLTLSVLLLLASCVFFLPAFRNCVIDMAEKALGRQLTRVVWHERMVHAETVVFIFLSIFSLYFLAFRALRFSSDDSCGEAGARTIFDRSGGRMGFLGWKTAPNVRRGEIIALFCVFAVCSLFRFYWMNQKTGFHEDELYSIGICNRNRGVYGFWDRELETGRAYTGAEITKGAYFDSASPLDVADDVFHLWVNTKDSPHPNVYYILLRLWFSFTRTSDFKTIFIRASLLNYVFFIASFLLFVRLALLYTKNIISISLLALIAFCNPASVGLSVFIRPYALQETAFIFFSYLFARYCSFLKDGASDFPLPLHAKSVLILAFLLLTGYFCTFFAVILGAALVVFCAARKDWNAVLYFVSLFLGAVVVSKIVYLYYGVGFFEGRGTEAISKLSDRLTNLTWGTKTAVTLISRNVFGFWHILCTVAASL